MPVELVRKTEGQICQGRKGEALRAEGRGQGAGERLSVASEEKVIRAWLKRNLEFREWARGERMSRASLGVGL